MIKTGRPIFSLALCLLFAAAAFAQTDEPPKVCISQAAANKCAENARTVAALEAKIAVLEEALKLKDASIAELTETNRRNIADLTDRLHRTENDLATRTGQLIGAEASVTRLTAIIDFMLKNGRTKKYGIINF